MRQDSQQNGDPLNEHWLTSAEVSSLFRVDRGTVARWAKAGRIHAVRTPGGRDLRYRESEVRALLEGNVDADRD